MSLDEGRDGRVYAGSDEDMESDEDVDSDVSMLSIDSMDHEARLRRYRYRKAMIQQRRWLKTRPEGRADSKDTDFFACKLWKRGSPQPRNDIGYIHGTEELLNRYADDISERTRLLQARTRGYLERLSKSIPSPIQPEDPLTHCNGCIRGSGLHEHVAPASSSPESGLKNLSFAGSGSRSSPDLHIDYCSNDSVRSTDDSDCSFHNRDSHEVKIDDDVLRHSGFADEAVTDLPPGWSCSWDRSGRPSFYHSATDTTQALHPYHEYARLGYGITYNLTQQWVDFVRKIPESPSSASEAPQYLKTTFGSLALQRVISDQEVPAWWIAEPKLKGSLCDTCCHIDYGTLVERAVVRQLMIPCKPLNASTKLTRCTFCRLVWTLASTALSETDLTSLAANRLLVGVGIFRTSKEEGFRVDFDVSRAIEASGSTTSLAYREEGRHSSAWLEKLGPALVLGPVNLPAVRGWLSRTESAGVPAAINSAVVLEHACDASTVVRAPTLTVIDVLRECLVYKQPHEPYVALSYVWGSNQIVVNTTSLNDCLRSPGSLKRLNIARTVRDAMHFLRELGQRYLWVDSLCIVQDDGEDKGRHLPNMHRIYAGADFTIVAAQGVDCQAGLPGVGETTRLAQHMEVVHGIPIVEVLPGFDNVVSHTKWATRAWTYQEWEMNPRSIIFTEREVFLRHGRQIARESQGAVHSEKGDDLSISDFATDLNLKVYLSIVRQYTARQLTYEADIHNAFKGIEAVLCYYFRGDIIYGLPVTEIDLALLWRTEFALLRRRRDFPSWSWMGWIGRISEHLRYECTHDDVSRVQWQDSRTGEQLLSEELRRASATQHLDTSGQASNQMKFVPSRNLEKNLLLREFGSDVLYYDKDLSLAQGDPTSRLNAPCFLHSTVPEAERERRTLLRSGEHVLRFTCMTASLRIVPYPQPRLFGTDRPGTLILSADGFIAGQVMFTGKAPNDLFTGQLLCLSRRRAGSSESFIYPGLDIPDAADLDSDCKLCPEGPQLFPLQGLARWALDGSGNFDKCRYNVHIPFPLYNVMLVEDRGDGILERRGIGTVHITAFWQARPEKRFVELG